MTLVAAEHLTIKYLVKPGVPDAYISPQGSGKLNMIKVVNKYAHKPDARHDVYIGRGSAFGNPFTHRPLAKTKALFSCICREAAIASFKSYFYDRLRNDPSFRKLYSDLRTKSEQHDLNLVCFCKPKDCHGDIIKQYLES